MIPAKETPATVDASAGASNATIGCLGRRPDNRPADVESKLLAFSPFTSLPELSKYEKS